MVRRTQKENKEITRDRLRQAALELFAKDGVRGASIENITQLAGYSRGAFYANYKNKLDLLVDLLKNIQVSEVRTWRSIIEGADDPEEGLNEIIHRFQDYSLAKHRRLLSLELHLEASRNEFFEPIFKEYLDATHREARTFFELLLFKYKKAVPKEIDSFVITSKWLALGLGIPMSLGSEIAERTSAGQIILDSIHRMIDSSPNLEAANNHDE